MWKMLTGTDGRTYHVNVEHVAYIIAELDCSWVHFAGRGNHADIGAIAVRATPAEILNPDQP